MGAAIEVRGDFSGEDSTAGAGEPGRRAGAAPTGAGGDPRWRHADGSGADRRGRAADRAGLGAALQCGRSGRADRPQGARQGADADGEQRAALARVVEAGPEPWRDGGALAADRPGAMAVGGVPGVGERGDGRAGAAGARLPQAVGAAAALRPGSGGEEAFKKVSRSAWWRSGPRTPASA